MNWNKIQSALAHHVEMDRAYSIACRERSDAEGARDSHSEYCLKDLKAALQRRANAKVKHLTGSLHGAHVCARPFTDHRSMTARAFVTVSWASRGGRFDLEAIVASDEDVTRLMRRLAQTIMINRDPVKEKTAAH